MSHLFSDGFREDVNVRTNIDSGIPPASNLTIQLQLISWKSVVDITRDRKVVKKIIQGGEGFDCPDEGSLVKGSLSYESKIIYIQLLIFPIE